ncbi:hypothetical protein ME1_01079 [Bartonella vinsonii subsp. arupensis OK-94-513]|uniref:Uncharacterized protein n=2 Tax=Bartonella vinsonii subsp. arupensis TaxID=110578 RepID=J1JRL9_BARVI|nr:hypothetical protein [Bartonella vinsonii]EJF87477.1 hypothetical protein ME1_01079 [Bartonella vinsonii subsp. arupensis OK-94-513]EJF98919.1 hypothetical protein MEI_00086 [Bartonella vinsonii subsp. arupensis Pm136co]
MNIRYYFFVCAIILLFSSVVKASEHMVFQKETSVVLVPTVTAKNMFLSEPVLSFDSLLNKVIAPAHPGKHGIFWKTVTSAFSKLGRVYADLGRYLYASIFSIFNW